MTKKEAVSEHKKLVHVLKGRDPKLLKEKALEKATPEERAHTAENHKRRNWIHYKQGKMSRPAGREMSSKEKDNFFGLGTDLYNKLKKK